MKRIFPIALLTAGMVLGGGFLLTQGGGTNTAQYAVPGAAMAQEANAETKEIVEMVLGAEDAPVEIIEYASYTCPHCANFHTNVFDDIKKNYIETGKVKFVYREVYFDKYGIWASLVARCGGEEKFFGITDLIYKGQKEWARAGSDGAIADELRKIGKLAGIGQDEVEACLTDANYIRSLVEWYQANAERDNIQSTPSFLIDGEPYSNMSYAEFAETLDEKIAAKE